MKKFIEKNRKWTPWIPFAGFFLVIWLQSEYNDVISAKKPLHFYTSAFYQSLWWAGIVLCIFYSIA